MPSLPPTAWLAVAGGLLLVALVLLLLWIAALRRLRDARRLAALRDQEAARELRWLFEELRVAVFAPELRTPVPVSLPKMTAAVQALR